MGKDKKKKKKGKLTTRGPDGGSKGKSGGKGGGKEGNFAAGPLKHVGKFYSQSFDLVESHMWNS